MAVMRSRREKETDSKRAAATKREDYPENNAPEKARKVTMRLEARAFAFNIIAQQM